MKQKLPGGAWDAALSSDMVAAKTLRLGALEAHGDTLYWSEGRPGDGGTQALVSWSKRAGINDVLPEGFSARTRVHEYGGKPFHVSSVGIFFVNGEDQDVYLLANEEAKPRRLTNMSAVRFADLSDDPQRRRLVMVAEDHGRAGHDHPRNFLAAIGYGGDDARALVELQGAHDFYANPSVSPDGAMVAFLAWDLPYMPWQAATLYVCTLGVEGRAGPPVKIAGGIGKSVFQPQWRQDGGLVFIAETDDGTALPHIWDGENITALAEGAADWSRPLWALGTTGYAVFADGTVVGSYTGDGVISLGLLPGDGGDVTPAGFDVADIVNLTAGEGFAAGLIAQPDAAQAVAVMARSADALAAPRIIRPSVTLKLDRGDISVGRHVTFTGDDGDAIHGFYYPPANARCDLPDGVLPPAIVTAHGGPTGNADRGLRLKTQYWTNRGFAWLDVDYRGSTGYGRAYRDQLNGQWGILDMRDFLAGARWLVAEGLADKDKLIATGSSSGGYTVLQALVADNLFSAAAIYYGIGDLAALAADTHKFEAGYLHVLCGVTPETEAEIFRNRSPIHQADRIATPVIFFQGLDDNIVPPSQSRAMAENLIARGVATALVEFEGEGHGFRKPETVKAALALELSFYDRVLELGVGETLPPLKIDNLD